MAIQNPVWQSFNAGELSPLMGGRVTEEKYFAGCLTLENFIPTVQGPAIRRGGLRLVASSKDPALKSWLATFEFSQAQSYILEFYPGGLRFFTNRGQLLSGGVPYEIATPFSAADLTSPDGTFGLRFVQLYDVLWIVSINGLIPPQKLQRFGATNWVIVPAPLTGGPFDDVNPDQTITVVASAETGVVTLTASAVLFRPEDAGQLFYMESLNPATVIVWETAKAKSVGNYVRYGGNVYKATTAATTGSVPPTHIEGTGIDGTTGVTWQYQHSTYGWVLITAVDPGGLTATATVVSQLPLEVTGATVTNRWARQSFNAISMYPTAISFFRDRLVYGRTKDLFMSTTSSYDNFEKRTASDILATNSLHMQLSSDRIESVRWLREARDLLIGSSRIELSVREQTSQQVFGPNNSKATPDDDNGSNYCAPLRIKDGVLFANDSGQFLLEYKYDYNTDKYVAEDLNVLSPHICEEGIAGLAYQKTPDPLVWVLLADGTLAAMIYHRKRGVVGWVRMPMGAGIVVESIAAIKAPAGKRDDLWMSVLYQGTRYIGYLEDYRIAYDDLSDAFFVDLGVTYSGSPTTVITGLNQFPNGTVVQVLADGSPHADRTVQAGSITLAVEASKVHVGLKYLSRLRTMPIEPQTPQGTAQGRHKAIPEATFRLYRTLGGRVGPDFDHMVPIAYQKANAIIGTRLELYDGDIDQTLPADTGKIGAVAITQDQPVPMTLVAIFPRVTVHGA
jgi:hypothetical protein